MTIQFSWGPKYLGTTTPISGVADQANLQAKANMFADVQHFTALFSSSWPAVTISDDPANNGNSGASWNYGAMTTNEFGGMGDGSAPTDHTIFGDMGVEDEGYDAITLCPGTAGAVCSG